MSKAKQLDKNFKLSEKLAEYIASNPQAVKKFPVGVSFVAFSSTDKKLNKLNLGLVESLKGEGKKVVKAKQKLSKSDPWSLTLAV